MEAPPLAQLHQERLELFGVHLFNTTITRIKPTEGSVTVADSITVPLITWPHCGLFSTVCLAVCMWLKDLKHYKKSRFCSRNSETSLKKKTLLKKPPHPLWSTLDIISASCCLILCCLNEWFSVSVSECICTVCMCVCVCVCAHVLCYFTAASIRVAGASAVQGENAEKCYCKSFCIFSAASGHMKKISFMFL